MIYSFGCSVKGPTRNVGNIGYGSKGGEYLEMPPPLVVVDPCRLVSCMSKRQEAQPQQPSTHVERMLRLVKNMLARFFQNFESR